MLPLPADVLRMTSAQQAMDMLVRSDRVYEDLEMALYAISSDAECVCHTARMSFLTLCVPASRAIAHLSRAPLLIPACEPRLLPVCHASIRHACSPCLSPACACFRACSEPENIKRFKQSIIVRRWVPVAADMEFRGCVLTPSTLSMARPQACPHHNACASCGSMWFALERVTHECLCPPTAVATAGSCSTTA